MTSLRLAPGRELPRTLNRGMRPGTSAPVTDRAALEDLSEGQVITGLALTTAEAAALNRSGLVTASPSIDGWTVTAEYAAGVIKRAGLTVRVRPKIGSVQVLTLLARALSTDGLKIDREHADVAGDADLSAVLSTLFAHEAARGLAGGPMRGYRTEDQSLPVLRGRLRMRDQQLRRFGLPSPVEVTVDEWTLDTDENRRLRAAARELLAQPGLTASAEQTLRWLDRMLVEVTELPRGAVLRPWTPTRLNTRLHRLLHLADLVLLHRSVEQDTGDTAVHGFVVTHVVALREAGGPAAA